MRSPLAVLPIGALLLATSVAAAPSDVAWKPVESMGSARAQHVAVALPDRRVLVLGGTADPIATGELFDGAWKPTSALDRPLRTPKAALLAKAFVLVADGEVTDGGPAVYDPENNRWADAPPMTSGRRGGYTLTTLADGSVLAAGGTKRTAGSETFRMGDDAWRTVGAMVTERSGHTATLLRDGRVLAVGGTAPTAELFQGGEWATTKNRPLLAHAGHTATLLDDGRVLVVGGDAAIAEVFDPRDETWALTGEMKQARTGHAAALLANGQVLVTGGTSGGEATDGAELYDPATNAWSGVEPMGTRRTGHSLTAIDPTRVLAAGGSDGRTPLTSAELATVSAAVDVRLAPATSSGLVGSTHTITATVAEDGRPAAQRTVAFTVTGANPRTGAGTTDASGRAVFSYAGTAAGGDTIEAAYVDDLGGRHTATARRTWTTATIALSPPASTGRTGTQHTVSATVREGGAPVANRAVTFTVTGANPHTASRTTDAGGVAAYAYTGTNGGIDTITASYEDGAGGRHTATAQRTWNDLPAAIAPVPQDARGPTGTAQDRDRDSVLDAQDNCPDSANADQADGDADRVGDACDPLPPAARPVAGATVRVEVLEGEVFIRLPAAARSSKARAAQAPLAGFMPLKGIATVPIGSIVDARRGTLALSAAADYRKGLKRRLQRARLAAALFKVRQAPAKGRKPKARAAIDLLLKTPPGLAKACKRTSAPTVGPAKGVVRTLSGSGRGTFRTVGAASTTTVKKGNWVVNDRCNGTETQVGRGTAKVFDKGRHRTLKVRAGQRYLAKARLFAARKQRR